MLEQIKTLSTKLEVTILFEAISVQEVQAVSKLSIDGIIAKGHEASGLIGETTAFVLMQECLAQTKMPVYVWGGIGLHTAAACYAAGATGIILDSQLLLARESTLPLILKSKLEQFDGTELQVVLLNSQNKNLSQYLGLRVYFKAIQTAFTDQPNALIELFNGKEASNFNSICKN